MLASITQYNSSLSDNPQLQQLKSVVRHSIHKQNLLYTRVHKSVVHIFHTEIFVKYSKVSKAMVFISDGRNEK